MDGSCDVDDDEDDVFDDDDDDDGVDDDDDDADDDDEDEDGFVVVAFLFDFSPPTFLFSAVAVLFVLLLPVVVEFIDLSGPIDESILVVTNSSFS